MKEIIRVRVQCASRQQCSKTHKRPFFIVGDATTITKYTTVNFIVFLQVVCFKSSSCIHNASILLELDTASLGTSFPAFLVKGVGQILQGRKFK